MVASEEPRELAVLNRLAQALAKAMDIEEVTPIRDMAEAALAYAKSARLGLTFQNRAAAMRLRAERKLGKILAEMHLKGGDRRSRSSQPPATLKELGISYDQSMRYQKLAAVSEETFFEYEQHADEMGVELTGSGLLRRESRRGHGPGATRASGNRERTGADRSRPESASNAAGGDTGRVGAASTQYCQVECAFGHPVAVREIKEVLEEAAKHCQLILNLLTGPRTGQSPEETNRALRHYLSEVIQSVERMQRKLRVRR